MNEDITWDTLKKISWAAAVVLLTVATFLFFYSAKRQKPETLPVSVQKNDTEKEKIQKEVELIQKGYVRSIAGEIESVSDNKDKIVINNQSLNLATGEPDRYAIAVGSKVSFSKVTYVGRKSEEISKENFEEFEEENFQEEREASLAGSDVLQKGAKVEIFFSEPVILDGEKEFPAKEINLLEREESE